MLLDVIDVSPQSDFVLKLKFENNEVRYFDTKKIWELSPFDRLQNEIYYQKATIEHGTVSWPGELDISPVTLYDLSVQDGATL